MAEPKKRMTSCRSGNRRSHDHLEKINLANCNKCNEPKLPHTLCSFCGTYKNRTVISVNKKKKN